MLTEIGKCLVSAQRNSPLKLLFCWYYDPINPGYVTAPKLIKFSSKISHTPHTWLVFKVILDILTPHSSFNKFLLTKKKRKKKGVLKNIKRGWFGIRWYEGFLLKKWTIYTSFLCFELKMIDHIKFSKFTVCFQTKTTHFLTSQNLRVCTKEKEELVKRMSNVQNNHE